MAPRPYGTERLAAAPLRRPACPVDVVDAQIARIVKKLR
jgi:hypothetical protein